MKPRFFSKQSLGLKTLLIFLGFVIPIYLIGFGLFIRGRDSIRHQIQESQMNRANFFMEDFDAEIDRIRVLQYHFFSDISLVRLTDSLDILSNYERDMRILAIQTGLNSIKNSSRYIRDVSVLIPSQDRKISTTGNSPFSDKDIETLNNIGSENIVYKDQSLYLYSCAYIGYDKSRPNLPKYCMEICLSNKSITETTESLLQTGEDYIFYLQNTPLIFTSFAATDPIVYAMEKQSAESEAPFRLNFDPQRYQVYQTQSTSSGMRYISAIDEGSLYEPIRFYLLLFIFFSILTLVSIGILSFYFRKSIHLPLRQLLVAFRQLENGKLNIRMEHQQGDEFQDIYEGFNRMTKKLDQLIEQLYRQKMLAQKAELRQLQAQINPHFLFNCFFILKRRIHYGDMETAERLSDHLGEYFRFITRTASDTITLAEEVRHAQIYAKIQAARFSERIHIDFADMPKKYGSIQTGRLILQPVIENAFEYGLEDKEKGGILRVSFSEESGTLVIAVEDNGDKLSDEKILQIAAYINEQDAGNTEDLSEITGVLNIHKRLKYQMGDASGLHVARSSLGGLCVKLVMTLGEESNVHTALG